MINFNAINKTSTAQSLLPSFSETTDISGSSFQSIMNSMNEFSKDNSNNPYSKKDKDYSSYRENNSRSSISNNKQNNKINKYETSKTNYKDKKENKHISDKENYEAVEQKIYRDDNVLDKNVKDTNTIKAQNVFEKRDIKAVKNNIISENNVNENNNQLNKTLILEDMQDNEISIKDILSLLQTNTKDNSDIVSNDENIVSNIGDIKLSNATDVTLDTTNLKDINLTDVNLTDKVSADKVSTDIDVVISKLNNISDDLKLQLKEILLSLENIPQQDLSELAVYTDLLSYDINIPNISIENISLEDIVDKVFSNISEDNSLDISLKVLQEQVSKLTNQDDIIVDNDVVITENHNSSKSQTQNIVINNEPVTLDNFLIETSNNLNKSNNINKNEENTLNDILVVESDIDVENTKILFNDETNKLNAPLLKIIENISSFIDEALNEANFNTKDEKLEFIKDVALTIKNVSEDILSKPDIFSKTEPLLNISQNSSIQLESKAVIPQIVNDTLLENTENIDMQEVNRFDDTILEENITDIKQVSEKTTKDTVKQAEVVTVKDIQKEFKTANIEVTESLRNESNIKAETKAKTVTFNETNKNLQNNLTQKEIVLSQNNSGENFSTQQIDKGNNFNYFLKSSAEAQANYDVSQNKETQAPYNMKEPRDIERLLRNIQSSISKGQSKLTVVLTPENLGKLQIQLSESGGKVTAKFLADNESSHKMIMAQSDMFKNQLSEKGIVIDNMEFAYNDAMGKQQNNDENGKRTSKQLQKNKGFKNQEETEVGIEVANKRASGIYA